MIRFDEVATNTCYVMINQEEKKITLNQHCNLQLVGKGANGIVLKGINTMLDRTEAIKIYIPNQTSKRTEVSEQQFKNEVGKVALLNDKRYVTIYSAYKDQPGIYICIMEYIKGQVLNDWIKEKHSKLKKILICKKVINAIVDYQKEGIFHGDIHGGNILIDGDEEIHIIDFGTSIFGGEKYTRERESFFIYTIVSSILGENFNEDFFVFRKRSDIRIKKSNADDDVKKFHPYLVALTMQSYIDYLDYREQICEDNISDRDVVELCIRISKGIYYNVKQVVDGTKELAAKCNKTVNDIAWFIRANWEENTFPEYIKDYDQAERLMQESLVVYYNLAHPYFKSWNWNVIKVKIYEKYHGFHLDYDKYVKMFQNSDASCYEEFKEKYLYKRDEQSEMDFDKDCRMIMYEALLNAYNSMGVTYAVWIGMNELWADKIFGGNK